MSVGISHLVSLTKHEACSLAANGSLPTSSSQQGKHSLQVESLYMESIGVVAQAWKRFYTGFVLASSAGVEFALGQHRLVEFLLQVQVIGALPDIGPAGGGALIAFYLGIFGGRAWGI